MASFQSEIQLKLPNKKGLITGIEPYDDSEKVLITHDNKYVMIYNIADQKVVKDWTVKGQNITAPAVCYGSPDQFTVALRESIRTWAGEDLNVEKSKKTSAASKVHQLWIPSNRDVPYVIYSDGSCASLDDSKSFLIDPQISEGSQIVWSGHTSQPNEVLVLVVKDKTQKFHTLVFYWEEIENLVSCIKKPLATNQSVNDFSLSGDDSSKVHLFVMVAEGKNSCNVEKICVYDKHGVDTGQSIISRVSDMSECKGLCALDENQVAVFGKNSSTKNTGLCVWDLKFGFQREFRCFDILQKDSKICKVGGNVFLSTNVGHFTLAITSEGTSLASALGQLQTQAGTLPGKTAKKNSVEYARSCLKNMSDKQKTGTRDKFEKELERFFEWESSANENQTLLISSEMESVAKRLATADFWPKAVVLERFVTCKSLQSGILLTLMPLLQKHNEDSVIHKALSTMADIPELCLVQALSCYMKNFKPIPAPALEKMETAEDQEEVESDRSSPSYPSIKSVFSTEDSAKLNQLLSILYNDVFLVECLRKLDFDDILTLIKHLVYLLMGIADAPEATKEERQPALEQVVSWLNAILDAHFAQVVLSADCRDVLLDLHQIVAVQVHFFEELVSLENLLYQLKKNVVLPAKQSVGQYCIQTLHVR